MKKSAASGEDVDSGEIIQRLRRENDSLRRDCERLRDLFDSAPSGHLIADAEGRVLEANRTIADLLGVKREGIVNRRFDRFVARSSREAFEDHRRAVRDQTEGHICELTLRRADGSTFFGQLDTRLVPDPDSGENLCRCVISDVSERRIAEEHYQLVFEENPLPMWIYEEETLRFLAVNEAAVRHYGWSRGEFLRMTLRDVRPPEDVAELLKVLKQKRGGRVIFAGEWRHRKKDGTVFEAAVTFSTIRFRGREARLAMIRDVSDRKQAEEARRASEERFRALVQASSDVVFRMSADWKEMHHLVGQDFVPDTAGPSQTWLERYIHPEDHKWVMNVIRKAIRTKSVFELEHRVRRLDGTFGWTFSRAIPVFNDKGRIVEWFGMASDVTSRKEAEDALRHSEAKYRVLYESLHDAFVSVDMRGRIQEFNAIYADLLGYSPEELRKLTYQRLTPRKWHDHEERILREEIVPNGYSRVYEKEYRRKDGTTLPVELRTFLIRDKAGKPVGMWAIVRDISERKRVEAELLASQRFARSTVEAIPAMVCVVDPAGDLIDTNQAWRTFANGFVPKPKKGEAPVNHLEVLNHIPGLAKDDAKRLVAGVREVADSRREAFSMEYACKPGESIRWFHVHVSPFSGPGDRHLVVAHEEITAVKLAEERFRSVVESAPDAMVIADEKGLIRIVNGQAEKLFGYPSNAMTGAKVEMLLPRSLRGLHVKERRKFSEAPATRGMGQGREVRALRKDGTEFPAEISLSPMETIDGRWVCAVVRDITERRKVEEAILRVNEELEKRVKERTRTLRKTNADLRRQAAERKRLEEEVLQIAEREQQRIGQDLHDDLGQRLAGAWLMSDSLRNCLEDKGSADSAAAAKVSLVLKEAMGRCRNLARGLQPVAAGEDGLARALRGMVDFAVETFRIECRSECPENLPISPTDGTHLYRIAQEAVTNAVRHGRAGSVSIVVSAGPRAIKLVVSDNGAGFVRRKADAGMGLRSMQSRVSLMNGKFEIRNRPGNGGCVVVCTVPMEGSRRKHRRVDG